MKKIVALTLGLLLMFGLIGCGSKDKETAGTDVEKVKIGVIQIVEHPALDAAREGFFEALKAKGYEEGKNLEIDYQNAQGDQPTLQSIAQKFASDKPKLVLAIATPSAQAMAAASKDIPTLITAVTDPVAAKLVASAEKPGNNVTGTTDMNPIKEQFDLLRQLVPNAKKVGVIYNAAEVNSQVQVDIVKKVAKELGITITEATVASSADVLQAAQSLTGKVDAIYVPTDNMVVSAAQAVVQVANKNKLPIISGESSVIEAGGLATIGINYKKLGFQTGEMALRVLNGENPADMAIESQKEVDVIVNQKTADLIGVTIPKEILDKAANIIK